ncbi:PREDICTED: uncharacterized protein LOC109480629 isoform X3 [Branchiostoma belcheri]|uniref:Uncharacterized protein LOC109480629 isoform X3 n=1 Tax=Branchiostoma belcheri TaxID=7741 RepID=A0A6P5A5E0_BRABE|nr:PREDICTED: uncharacterized protein LOC109480629 isoform X3 [Branchiostoma belcheri]
MYSEPGYTRDRQLKGISVTVLDFGGQVLDETRIFAPTAVQQHLIEHIAARAFSAFPMHGFTVRWPGGRPIPLGTSLDPLTAQNIILQMYHADEGDSSWQWRIVEEEVTGRSTYMYAVEANIHQQVNGGGEQREQDWDTSTHGSRGDEGEKVRDDGDKGYLCTICLDTEVDLLVEISCKHCFHQMCLQRWLQWQNKCPVCRKENPQILERES